MDTIKNVTQETWETEKERFEYIIRENIMRKSRSILELKVTKAPYQIKVPENEKIVETHIPIFVKVDGSSIGKDWTNSIFIDICSGWVRDAVWSNNCGVWLEHIVTDRELINQNKSKYYYREGDIACLYLDITFREYIS